MNKLLTILIFVFLYQGIALSQEVEANNWRQHKKLAEELLQKRNFAEAAMHYEMAHKLKPQKSELLFAAAENYLLVRDFRKASHTFGQLKNNSSYPLAGMKYALSLKQDKRYDDATREFTEFISAYSGADKAILSDKVQLEIEGCQFAMDQKNLSATSPYAIDHLNSKINTGVAEFAPIQYSDDILYYSSMVKGKAKLFRSQKNGNSWSKGTIPRGFQKLAEEHFCNGSFTPNGERFYFTICQPDQVWGELSARCEIYVTMKKGAAWKAPIKLPDYINLPNKTATQPFVVQKGSKEILYFSSNRASGQGGMDLWVAEKEIDSEGTDFTFPENLGPNINTRGDEITPYYNSDTETLFFSSTGHLTMGGFDILKSVGTKTSWSKAENLGAPFNSAADDTYYTSYADGSTGYFVSNRRFGTDKILTTQEDIFSYSMPGQQYAIRGIIKDELDRPLEEVYVYLYEFLEDEERRLLSTQTIDHTGSYEFRLLPGRRFQMALQKENFAPSTEYFNTKDETVLLIEKNVSMSRISPQTASASTEPIVAIEEKADEINKEIVEIEERVEEPVQAPEEPVVETIVMEVEQPEEPVQETIVIETIVEEGEVRTEPVVETIMEERIEQVATSSDPVVETKVDNTETTPILEEVKETIETPIVQTDIIEKASAPKEAVVMEPINEAGKEIITFVIDGDQIKSVEINDGTNSSNTSKNSNSVISHTIVPKTSSTPTISSSTRSYSTSDILVGKGSPSIPSGTGVYTYDEYNNNYRKEGGSNITYSNNAPSTYVDRSPSKNYRSPSAVTSEAPFVSGTYYKIQLIAVETHKPTHKRYDGVRKLGKRFDTEYIVEKGWTRVLLADCMDKSEANKILSSAKSNGFNRAYIVKYRDGARIGRVK